MNLELSEEMWFWRGPSPFHFKSGYTTSLFPKDGRYIVPVKDAVRNAEGLEVGDVVTVHLTVDV